MDLHLTGKVAVVVGAAGDMGRAVLAGFAAEGAQPVAVDLPARLAELDAAWSPTPMDVTAEANVSNAIDQIFAWQGRIDILVSLVGVYQAKPVEQISPEEWDRLLAINLKGTFLVSRAVLPRMRQGNYGRLILVASLAGQVGGLVAGAHYAASKAGVLSLTKSLAKQCPEPWLTVNAISPGPMEGSMTGGWPEADRQKMLSVIPKRRFARPEEIADLALFLSSPRAGHIHGARLDINGGAYMD